MGGGAPSYGTQEYWDERFTKTPTPHDWLEAPTALDPYLVAALADTKDPDPQILHIGCGTSLLSYHLREHVKDPESIHNLDYSDVAIKLGKEREVAIFNPDDNPESAHTASITAVAPTPGDRISQSEPEGASGAGYMRWSAVDLLSHTSLLNACKARTYTVIVDKSTSDSIACTEDVGVSLPYSVGISSPAQKTCPSPDSQELIHPLHILAIHMALVAKPAARWLSVSYSEDRFSFLLPPRPVAGAPTPVMEPKGSHNFDEDETGHEILQEAIDHGFPDPSTFWKLEGKYPIEVPSEPPKDGKASWVHTPTILHWVFVLRRTDVEVFVRQ